ncbi:MAG: hypothetical protein JWN83_399 [Chitinophagaceae bacterium]|nr:hypothetical protein [Chitinophagaceae bacterium]
MVQNINELEITAPQRPVFLKVLCILTFIGSGYGIINSAVTYFKADTISKIFVDAKIKTNEDLANKKNAGKPEKVRLIGNIMNQASIMSTPENLRKAAIGNIITSMLCLFGAILMWNLRRMGFYIYTIGTIISIILPFYMFGSNFLTNISTGLLGFIGILFVIFYAMNLKSIK